jgi:hypothetical protein
MMVGAWGLRVEIHMSNIDVALVDSAMGVRGQTLSHEMTQVITEGAVASHPLGLSSLSCS